jgi:hypothetical protein
MPKQYLPIEKVVEVFGNRYVALRLAGQEVRRIIEAMNKGEILPGSPYYEALRRLADKEVEWELETKPEPIFEEAPAAG